MGKSFVYRNTRPSLTIECTGGAKLGNCYNASYYRVTSLRRLDASTLSGMNRLGILGFGQEFMIRSQCDGQEPPAGKDTVECIVVDEATGKVLDEPALDYRGEPYKPSQQEYFVYNVESRVDSGD